MKKIKTIYLLQIWHLELSHDIRAGVLDYLTEHECTWKCVPINSFPDPLEQMVTWEMDGMITHVTSEKDKNLLRQASFHVVDCHGMLSLPTMGQVSVDHLATGRMASDYFKKLGFKELGIITTTPLQSITSRLQGYLQAVQEDKDLRLHHYSAKTGMLGGEINEITAWLKHLPKPCALYCVSDQNAFDINMLCRMAHLSVPDQIVLLGTENQRIYCEGAKPQLSSIQLPYRKLGYRAAEKLDQMLKGKKPGKPIILPPSQVVERQSSNIIACEDERLRKVISYLRREAFSKPSFSAIARESGMSLRALQDIFKKKIGHTMEHEMIQTRLIRAKQWLRESHLGMDQIAEKCGLSSGHYLSQIFCKMEGCSCQEYRAAAQKDE